LADVFGQFAAFLELDSHSAATGIGEERFGRKGLIDWM
jgi:hypothetical protein